MGEEEGRSLEETPTWTVATVITSMILVGFIFHRSLKHLGKWLDRTRKKSILAALEKIQEELMLFGLLSLMMGHWIVFVAKICVESSSSAFSSKLFPCSLDKGISMTEHVVFSSREYLNKSVSRVEDTKLHHYCPEGKESFVSKDSLEQLHRLIFVLSMTYVVYSFFTIFLAMIKIYSWRTWENEAKAKAIQSLEENVNGRNKKKLTPRIIVVRPQCGRYIHLPLANLDPLSSEFFDNLETRQVRRMSTFIAHHVSHPWSQHTYFVWLLPLIYSIHGAKRNDFHNYMLRSMEDELRDIVGIIIPLWIYAICCIMLNFHGSNLYFWLSFLPAILILAMGTKLHRIVVKLAVEIMEEVPYIENHQFHLRDELFWFKRPRLLLQIIQLISFQNAFEMATFIWYLWEIRHPSCFMDNKTFLVIRLIFGIVSQFWCSFITFPLYVIIAQMGSSFKKAVVSESIRQSLNGWRRRVKARRSPTSNKVGLLSSSSPSSNVEGSSSDSTCKVVAENVPIDQASRGYERLEPEIATMTMKDEEDEYHEDDYDHFEVDEEYDSTMKMEIAKDDLCLNQPSYLVKHQ